MSIEQVQEIELNIKQARKKVDLGESLERLKSNRDFKRLVLDGYFKSEAIRLVHLKSDPSMQTAERQAAILSDINAIGSFSQYLAVVTQMAGLASKAIVADEQTIEEISAEELSQ